MKTMWFVTLVVIFLTFAAVVYPYGATTVTLRVPLLSKNTASAVIGNPGLSNGSFSTWAEVDSPDNLSGSFANEIVGAFSGDMGPYNDSGSAYAYVNGYDKDGRFQHDDDTDTN